ncbi:MAG: AMP-binding protein [Dehalococcoidales bacterium]|nr:AMP-binding protein [Dehalococcoidales bacterium]
MNATLMLEKTVQKFGARIALVSGERRISYSDVDATTSRIANALAGMGIRKGDRVALLITNSPEFAFAYFGILKLGAVVVALDNRYKAGELASVLANCQPRILIGENPCLEPVAANLPLFPSLEKIISLAPDAAGRFISYPEILANSTVARPEITINPDDLAMISYSGGPTSHPKGAVITHRNLCAEAAASGTGFAQNKDDVIMLFALPMYHNFALGSVLLTSVSLGSCIVIVPGTGVSIGSLMETIQREKGTMWLGVPYIFALAVKIAAEEGIKSDLSSLRLVASGGAPLPVSTIIDFQKHFRLPLLDVWGLTEAVSHVTCPPVDGSGPLGSCGRPIPGFEVKIVDDNSNELPADHDGEIIVRGPMMECYYHNPEDTAKALKNGWLYTGDIGKIDKDGFVYITGRKKRMIILKGQNVYPRDIEEILLTHPKVAEAKVVGVTDKLRGEIVSAIIRLKEGQEASEQEIKQFCHPVMADYKVPKQVIFTRYPARTGASN